MKRFMIVCSAAAIAFTTACGNTADGARKDAEEARENSAEAAEKSGEAIGAAMETFDVKGSLVADTRINSGDINVDTNKDTKTVTLNGTVPDAAQQTLAGEVARDKAPGYSIVNNLAIKP